MSKTRRGEKVLLAIAAAVAIALALLPGLPGLAGPAGLAGATPPIRGDYSCDNILDGRDALIALQVHARLMPETACARFVDWDADGEAGPLDALGILQRLAGIA